MNDFSTQSFDQKQQSNIIDDDNFENDDLITFEYNSKTINLYFSQIIKYIKYVRDSYKFIDIPNHFPQKIQNFKTNFNLFQRTLINAEIKLKLKGSELDTSKIEIEGNSLCFGW